MSVHLLDDGATSRTSSWFVERECMFATRFLSALAGTRSRILAEGSDAASWGVPRFKALEPAAWQSCGLLREVWQSSVALWIVDDAPKDAIDRLNALSMLESLEDEAAELSRGTIAMLLNPWGMDVRFVERQRARVAQGLAVAKQAARALVVDRLDAGS